tara:strand:- start:1689 stop:2252 length:564 start_codon:yes stop_codon:yes gene_type:complete
MVLSKTAPKTAKKPLKTEVKKGGKVAKAAKKASKKAAPSSEGAEDKPKLRWFTIQGSGTGFVGGRYAAKDGVVGTASRKAGARLFRDLSEVMIKNRAKKGNDDIKFILRETTRNSKKNTYYFKVTRVVLDEPVTIKKGAIEYSIKHKYAVKSVGSTECDDIAAAKESKESKSAAPKKDKKKSTKSKA